METTIAIAVLEQSISFIVKLTADSKVFFSTLCKIILIYKVASRIVGRVYVLTDFDTKEKALSGAKATEKGLK